MLGYLFGVIRARRITKFTWSLYQRILIYFYDRGQTPSNLDNEYILANVYSFCMHCTMLEYANTSLDYVALTGTICETTLNAIGYTYKIALRKMKVDSKTIDDVIDNFVSNTREYRIGWQQILHEEIKENASSGKDAFEMGVKKFVESLESYTESSQLNFPDDIQEWLKRMVISETQKYGVLSMLQLNGE